MIMPVRHVSIYHLAAAACVILCPTLALALIESPMPLEQILKDSDEVFVARFDRIDPEKPSAVLVWDKDLVGKTPHRRLPVNLQGDKEKHTPEFLKRIAPKLPVVLFVTNRPQDVLVLGYTNGTWFQVLGTKENDGKTVRWAFTHCEIYFRRTFTGTTKEMIDVVTDAVAGKKKPPKLNPKEKPGFGPEVKEEEKSENQNPNVEQSEIRPGRNEGKLKSEIRNSNSEVALDPRGTARGLRALVRRVLPLSLSPCLLVFASFASESEVILQGTEPGVFNMLFWPAVGVVTLPFLAPLAVLLQLLFPGLLRDQWRQYKIVISVLMMQSTLLATHWVVVRWLVSIRPRWLADDVLWGAMVAVAVVGLVAAAVQRWRRPAGTNPIATRPAPVEYFAVSALLASGLGWAAFLYFTGGSPFDQMFVVTVAAAVATMHLGIRRRAARAVSSSALSRPSRVTTELVLLSVLVLAGAGLGWHVNAAPENRVAGTVTAEWPTFRGNPARTGSVAPDDVGPAVPEILWTFDPKVRKGRIRMHSSPAVVDGQVYLGALYQLQSLMEGVVYCVNAADGRQAGDKVLAPGEATWQFTADGSLKPVFSSPTVARGRLYFGEGYHQDQSCRLICLDARRADRALWMFPTASHVESSPCIVDRRIYFGAGDDGILCLDLGDSDADGDYAGVPKQVWQFPNVHVDGSCVVADGKLFVGSVMGDVYKEFCALAVNVDTGKEIWRVSAPMPLPASPAYTAGRVYFGLGNGKFDLDADDPAGAVWCRDAANGRELWHFDAAGSVLATSAIEGDHVIVCSRDAHCYCLSLENGGLIWKFDLGSPINASPVVAGEKVYVLAATGLLICLGANDGKELWRLTLDVPDEDAYSSPTLANGRLYVAAGGKLYCLGTPVAASGGH